MPNDDKNPYGSSIEEVQKTIQQLEQERRAIAEKIKSGDKISRKENKRFGELDDELTQANQAKSTFQPIPGAENLKDQPFEIDRKTVIGEDPIGGNRNPSLIIPPRPQQDQDLTTGAPLGGVPVGQPTAGVGNMTNDLGEPGPGINAGQIPQSGSEGIIQKTLQGVNRQPQGSENDIDSAISKSTFDPAGGGQIKRPEDPLIPQGARTTLGIQDPILKGNVSGSVIGNQPIFVGGGDFVAFDVINNRRMAIQQAAAKRQQEAQALLNQKPPLVKDQRFQKNLNNQFYGTIEKYAEEAQQRFGDDWDIALKDQTNPLGRKFIQDLSNYNFVAGQMDQVTDLVGEIDEDLESGDRVFSDATLDLRDQYNSLQGAFLNGEINGVVDLADKFGQLQGYASLDKIINDQKIDVKGQVTQVASIIEDDTKLGTRERKKTEYEDQLRIIAKGLAKEQMRDAVRNGFITEEEIFERLNARYGYEDVTNISVSNKPKETGISITIDPEKGQNYEQDKQEKIGGTVYDVAYSYEIPSEVKSIDATGLRYYDPEKKEFVLEDGVGEIDVNSFQVIKVPGGEYKKVAIATTEEMVEEYQGSNKPPKKVKKEVTRAYDIDQLGARFMTDRVSDPEGFKKVMNQMDEVVKQKSEPTKKDRAIEFLND